MKEIIEEITGKEHELSNILMFGEVQTRYDKRERKLKSESEDKIEQSKRM